MMEKNNSEKQSRRTMIINDFQRAGKGMIAQTCQPIYTRARIGNTINSSIHI
jgi:hypothetical protein